MLGLVDGSQGYSVVLKGLCMGTNVQKDFSQRSVFWREIAPPKIGKKRLFLKGVEIQ